MPGTNKSQNKPNPNCPKCGRKASSGASGSITQWLIVCNCNNAEPSDPALDVSFCATCGKRVSGGRAGSLTQWIFRSDLCRCAVPTLTHLPPASPPEQIEQQTDEPIAALSNLPFEERYQKIRELGLGGAGRVALYFDTLLKKQVAVKRSIELTARLAIDFQNEARALSRLRHPNIVDILDFGADNGRPYIVMTFIEGTSLTQYIEQHGPLPENLAIALFIKLTDALSHSHRADLLHRDIKSSNVMLTGDADSLDVVLIDFGIASLNKSTTKPEEIAGTPAYMSPEQFSGNKYDQRSEVYSIGCMLFEVLSGQPPFVAETALQTISMHANATVPSLQQNNLDERIEPIVLRALEKDPDKRFQSAAQMKDALAGLFDAANPAAQNSESTVSEPSPDPTKAPYMTPILIASSIVLGLVSIGIYNLLQEKPQPVEKPKPKSNVSAFFDVGAIEPRFERSIGRSKTDLANQVEEKIYAFKFAVADNNTRAKEEAEQKLLEVQKLCKVDSRANAAILTALASYRRLCKRFPEALKMAKDALRIYEATPPPQAKLCEIYTETANIYREQGDKKEAQKFFDRAVQLVKETPTQTQYPLLLMDVSFLNAMEIGAQKSAKEIPEILENLIQTGACKKEDVIKRFLSFSEMARQHKHYKLEEHLMSRATNLLPPEYSTASRFTFFENLTKARMNIAQYHSAVKAAEQAETYAEGIPMKVGSIAGLYNLLAYHLRLKGSSDEAFKLHFRALRLCELGPGKTSPPAVSTLIQLSDAYRAKDDIAKANKMLGLAYLRCAKNKKDDMSDLLVAITDRCREQGLDPKHF